MVLLGGAEVAVAVGKQASIGAEATTVYTVLLTDVEDAESRRVWRNEPEVGGSLYTGGSAVVLGARPTFRLAGVLRLNTFGHLLQMAGLPKGTNAGDGTSTPIVGPFTPTATSAAWPYYTVAFLYASGIKKSYIGARITRLMLSIRPGEPLRFEAEGVAINIKDSTLVATAVPGGDLLPSPAESIVAADIKIFGANTADMLSLDMMLENNFDTENQPIGGILSQDTVPTRLVASAEGALGLTNTYYNKLNFGSDAGTQLATALASGELKARINTPDNAGGSSPYTVPGYIEIQSLTTKYHMGRSVGVNPERQVLVPYAAIPATLVVRIMNGTPMTTYQRARKDAGQAAGSGEERAVTTTEIATLVPAGTLTLHGVPVSFKELTVADTLRLAEERQRVYSELLEALPGGEKAGTRDYAVFNARFDVYGMKIVLLQVASANGAIAVDHCTEATMSEMTAAIAEIHRLNPFLIPAVDDPNE